MPIGAVTSAAPRMRFTEVAPPFDERVAKGLFARVRDLVLLCLRIKNSVTETGTQAVELAQNETYVQHVSQSVVEAVRPGTVPFVLLAAATLLFVVRVTVVRVEMRRVLRNHEQGSESMNHGKVD